MDAEAGMVAMPCTAPVFFADLHWVPDLRSRLSRKDLRLKILARRKIVEPGSRLNKETAVRRNGSCRTAKGPS